MLTGDENIVDIDFSVFWVINNAPNFLFSMEDPEGTVKAAAESAMREVVGRSDITPLLTQARQITETDVQKLIQDTMNGYNAGVQITQVQLLKVDPPGEVIASFRDVPGGPRRPGAPPERGPDLRQPGDPRGRGRPHRSPRRAIAYRDRAHQRSAGPGRPLQPGARELPRLRRT